MKRLKALLCVAALAITTSSHADDYPSHSIRVLVPFGVGNHDFAARQVGKVMGDILGQTFIVENRPGGGGIIGAQALVNEPADGYTIFAGSVGTQIVNPLLKKNLPYDPDKQMVPIGMMTQIPSLLAVRADFPAMNLADFLSYAKDKSHGVTYAASGTLHLGMQSMIDAYSLTMRKIPYKGSAESGTAVASGFVDVIMDSAATLLPHIQNKRVIPLAIMGDKRLTSLPDIPTSVELGFPLYAGYWTGLFAPAGTPEPVLAKLSSALQQALKDPTLHEEMKSFDVQFYQGTREEAQDLLASDKEKVKKLVQSAGLSPQ